jgi:hypothetical protein
VKRVSVEIDPDSAKVITSVTSRFLALFVFGCFYFWRWDRQDRSVLMYSLGQINERVPSIGTGEGHQQLLELIDQAMPLPLHP